MLCIDIMCRNYTRSYNILNSFTQLYNVAFMLVKKVLSLDVTVVLLTQMEKLVYRCDLGEI